VNRTIFTATTVTTIGAREIDARSSALHCHLNLIGICRSLRKSCKRLIAPGTAVCSVSGDATQPGDCQMVLVADWTEGICQNTHCAQQHTRDNL